MNGALILHGLRYAAFASFFSGLFVVTRALVVGAPASPRLGLRGMHRQRKLAEGGSWKTIDPVVRWLGGLLNGLVDPELRAKLDRRLTLAGDPLGIVPEELVALAILSALAGLVLGIVFSVVLDLGSLPAMGGLLFGAWAPFSKLDEEQKRRYKLINRGLPGAIDLIALCMGAGLDFPRSIQEVIAKFSVPGDPLVGEMTLILQGLQLGQTRAQALLRFAERVPSPQVKDFTSAVVQAEERGNPLAPVLRIQAEVSRRRRSVAAEEAAAKAGTALAAPMGLILIVVLILIIGPIMLNLKSVS
jgi:tight adherence protein C